MKPEIAPKSISLPSSYEPWKYYYRVRKNEFDIVLSHVKLDSNARLLEVGCGNGYRSLLFSKIVGRVVASDLPYFDPKTHSTGLVKAQKLTHYCGVSNVAICGCSAESLPFYDGSFDIVFSSYVLEHITNKQAALREFHRVLKSDGMVIIIVPNFVERLYNIPAHYITIITRVIRFVTGKLRICSQNKRSIGLTGNNITELQGIKQRKRADALDIIVPKPHGSYATSIEELFSHMPYIWLKVIRNAGFRICSTFSTNLLPRNLLNAISRLFSIKLYEVTKSVHMELGKIFPFKYLGYSFAIVATREEG